jgi:hypothetical protein
MRVIVTMPTTRVMPIELKSPDMVTDVNAGRHSSLGQFGEIAIDRRSIKALISEKLGHLSMTDWPRRLK